MRDGAYMGMRRGTAASRLAGALAALHPCPALPASQAPLLPLVPPWQALAKCGMACDDWDAVSITDCQLSKKEIEQLVGMAVAEQLAADGPGSNAAAAADAAGAVPDPAAAAAADAGSPPAAQRSTSMEVVPQQAEASAAAAAEAASTIEAPAARERQASATVDEQPAAMQTDGDEAAAPAAAGSAPGDGTVVQPAIEGAGTAAAAAGQAAKVQPPWTLRAEHLMAAAEALRKLQAEAAAQPEKQALRDVAVDQYEKQLLSEVGSGAGMQNGARGGGRVWVLRARVGCAS